MKGKYGDAITLLVLMYVINFLAGLVLGFICGILGLSENIFDLISMSVSLILSGLFGFGMISCFLKISRNEQVDYKELFNKTDMVIPYIAIAFLTGLFVILWSLLFIIPGIIASFSYTLVYYIKLDNPKLGAMDVIIKSKEMIKGYKMDYFILSLSFICQIFLGIFTFGILYLWLVPYMSVTMCNFYNKLKENN